MGRLLDPVVGLKRLHRVGVAPARLEQRPRYREVGREGPGEVELGADRGYFRPRIEDVRDTVVPQHVAVNVREQLGVAQLDGVAEVARQRREERIELVGPLERVREVLPTHRLELEHEASGVIPERARVGAEHRLFEQIGIQEVGVAVPLSLVESLRGDPIPHLGDAREAGGESLRVGAQGFLGRRLVEGAVDPHRAEQRIARVLLEPPRRLSAAIAAVIDVAEPAVVCPRGRAEPNVDGEAARELYKVRTRLRKRVLPEQV